MKSISGKKLCRILEAQGWILKRIQGSHYIYAHEEQNHILTVPVHATRDLKHGTLSNLMKLAGLTESDL